MAAMRIGKAMQRALARLLLDGELARTKITL
jgi:hypothetical protein